MAQEFMSSNALVQNQIGGGQPNPESIALVEDVECI
jgi:hypothetical protein